MNAVCRVLDAFCNWSVLCDSDGSVCLFTGVVTTDAGDIAERTERKPMDAEAREAFFMRYLPGLLSLTVLYILLPLTAILEIISPSRFGRRLVKAKRRARLSWRAPSYRSPSVCSWSSRS